MPPSPKQPNPARQASARLLLLLAVLPPLQAAGPVSPEAPPLILSPLLVSSSSDEGGFDRTGMGAMESEANEPPFSNDLLAGASTPDETSAAIDVELGQIASPNPADLSAGQSRLDVRGFPSPRLRNGYTQLGVPNTLNVERGEQISGPLVSVTGRSAPGGINNSVTGRPRPKPGTQAGFSLSSQANRRVFFDTSLLLRPKRLWSRSSASWSEKIGPESFTWLRLRGLSQSFTWRINRASSLLVQADYADASANPSGGIPDYRSTRSAKIAGPYLPLGLFHTNGPDSGQRRRTSSLALQYEAQAGPRLSLRATLQLYSRRFTEDRFTRGEYLLDEQIFSGTREPLHGDQTLGAMNAQLEATWRFRALGAEHKLLAGMESSLVSQDRSQRGLDPADRATLLPLSVRTFNPAAPDYFKPAYDEAVYKRLLTDRSELTRFGGLFTSERAAFLGGRLVSTLGVRLDRVSLAIDDHRPGAAQARVRDTGGRPTWHFGTNGILVPGRLLVFANASTAYEPSLRVDARTGRIQGNETTFGYEAGATGLALHRTLSFKATLFTCFNSNIARRNPLYDHPVLDADHTQPQLVSAGEERFRGGALELKWRPVPEITLSAQQARTSAITTASPDLPEEVGRQLSRLPVDTSALNLRYAPVKGRWTGYSLSLGTTYIGPYVAWYESLTRRQLDYPGYTLLNAALGGRWVRAKRVHSLGLSLRNLLDADLLAKLARPGARRESSLSYTLSF